jgi:hypothetical protein
VSNELIDLTKRIQMSFQTTTLFSQTIFLHFTNNNACSLSVFSIYIFGFSSIFRLSVNPKGKDPKDIPYMQRPGGRADDSDLVGKKKTGGFSFFGGKKKEPEPEPEAPKKDNFWTF